MKEFNIKRLIFFVCLAILATYASETDKRATRRTTVRAPMVKTKPVN